MTAWHCDHDYEPVSRFWRRRFRCIRCGHTIDRQEMAAMSPKSERRQRTEIVSVRFTAEELQMVQDIAKAKGLAVGTLLREAAVGTPMRCEKCEGLIVDREYRSWTTTVNNKHYVHEGCHTARVTS